MLDPDPCTPLQRTPLHCACACGHNVHALWWRSQGGARTSSTGGRPARRACASRRPRPAGPEASPAATRAARRSARPAARYGERGSAHAQRTGWPRACLEAVPLSAPVVHHAAPRNRAAAGHLPAEERAGVVQDVRRRGVPGCVGVDHVQDVQVWGACMLHPLAMAHQWRRGAWAGEVTCRHSSVHVHDVPAAPAAQGGLLLLWRLFLQGRVRAVPTGRPGRAAPWPWLRNLGCGARPRRACLLPTWLAPLLTLPATVSPSREQGTYQPKEGQSRCLVW